MKLKIKIHYLIFYFINHIYLYKKDKEPRKKYNPKKLLQNGCQNTL